MSNMKMIKKMMNNRTNIKTMTNRRTKEMMNNMKTTMKQWAIGGPNRQWTTWKLGRLVKSRKLPSSPPPLPPLLLPPLSLPLPWPFSHKPSSWKKNQKSQQWTTWKWRRETRRQWTTRRPRKQWATRWSQIDYITYLKSMPGAWRGTPKKTFNLEVKLQRCFVSWVWNFWTKLEALQIENS